MTDQTNDDALCAQHDEYIKQVTESGMPIWMMDFYGSINRSREEYEHKLKTHESINKTSDTDAGIDDSHLFI